MELEAALDSLGAPGFFDGAEMERDLVGHETEAGECGDCVSEGVVCFMGDYEALNVWTWSSKVGLCWRYGKTPGRAHIIHFWVLLD